MLGSRSTARNLLYGATIFLSAFLLFLIQPVFAKRILPWFGGSAAVWTTCLVFFQTALLAGYFYAHVLSRRMRPSQQAMIHTVLLTIAIALLPAIPGDKWKPSAEGDPAIKILMMLTVVLGLPYLLLSATSPLLQSWYARRSPEPYRFFALSNVGALLALAAYPFGIEPAISVDTQSVFWSGGFAVFAILCGIVAWTGAQTVPASSSPQEKPSGRTSPIERWIWLLLAAAGSMMLVSTTNQLTQNVAAVPFLWILPLAVYLLTFIACFDSARWYRRALFARLLAIALCSIAYAAYDIQLSEAIVVAIPLYTIGLFIICMFCHGELSLRKPDSAALTSFYLMIALGGALGSIFTGLIAPRIFSGIYELPLSLVLVAALALWLDWREGWSQRLLWAVVSAAMVIALVEVAYGFGRNAILKTRSFYGALRVVESEGLRSLFHGTVKHGSQFLAAEKRGEPASYYGPQSGVALALRFCCDGPKRVGIIGLGTGSIAAYGREGDVLHFYEINPQVIEIARSKFSYLGDTKATVEIALGDARLSLENEPAQSFDMLIGDAFSGDAIPAHLLTKEAFAVYERHLKPSGILVIHVSNSYLDLAPVVVQLASQFHFTARQVFSMRDDSRALAQATWVLATRNGDFWHRPEIFGASAVVLAHPGLRMWTDNYNNLFEVVRMF